MTLTIDVPDDIAAQVSSLTEAERWSLDETLENTVAEAIVAFHEYDEEASQDLVAASLEAIEDMTAGRLLTIEEMDARFEKDFADARVRVHAQIHASGTPHVPHAKQDA